MGIDEIISRNRIRSISLLLFIIEIAVRKVTLPPAWRERIVRLFRRRGAPAPALTYGEWEELIEETRQQREDERRREGIIPIFKREREKELKQVYLARLRRRSSVGESQKK